MPLQRRLDNRYELRESLGSGGMAEVYLARDRVLGREVALKVLSRCYAEDPEFVRRFRREARSAAALSHPNVVSIHDLGETEEAPGSPATYYIAMEYVAGEPLRGLLEREGRLPIARAVEVARQVAAGLGAAHARGIVHRDVKPRNILLSGSGDSAGGWLGEIKVADFGIARAAGSEAVTGSGEIMGTAHYLSPEQVMGGEATPRSDLYGLGVVLYEALTGRRPYEADHPCGVAMQHVTGDLVPPRRLRPELPERLNSVVVRLLGKDPEERPRDAEELLSELEKLSGLLEDTAPEESARPGRGRSRTPALMVPVCALIVLAATLWGVQQGFGLSALSGLPSEVRHGVERVLEGPGGETPADDAGTDSPADELAPLFGDEPGGRGTEPGAGREGFPDSSRREAPETGPAPQPEDGTPGAPEAREEREPPQSGSESGSESGSATGPGDGSPPDPHSSSSPAGEPSDADPESGGTGDGSTEGEEVLYVPDLAGQRVGAARETLESTGLRVTGVVAEPGERPAGTVLRTDPPAGATLEPGSGVTIVASSGPGAGGAPGGSSQPPDTPDGESPGADEPAPQEPGGAPEDEEDEEILTVPDVSGRPSGQAVAILESAGLRAEVRGAFGGEEAGTVVASDPTAGSRVEEGSLVILTVVDESSPSLAAEPEESGEEQYQEQYQEQPQEQYPDQYEK